MHIESRITPFLSYPDQAQQAAEFYVSVLPDSRILQTVKNPANGDVLTVEFECCGLKMVTLNTGQDWKFTPAMSLAVACQSQEEIDAVWRGLTADGGTEVSCGWLTDKFGVSWQVFPVQVYQWLGSQQPDSIQRMFNELWQMTKIDLARLQAAFEGR